MTEFEQHKSGLIIPVTPEPPKPVRAYGPLEVRDEEDRKVIHSNLQKMIDLSCLRTGVFIIEDEGVILVRRSLFFLAAHLLLGNDAEFAEYC